MSKFTVYDFVVADRDMVAKGGSYTFRSYTDRSGVFGNPGAEVLFNDGTRNRDGKIIGKGFSLNQSHYKLQARDTQRDYDNKLLVDFFLNTPFTEGSPNGDYIDQDGALVPPHEVRDRDKNISRLKAGEIQQLNVKLRLMDGELDAEVALTTGLRRAKAQLSALEIDDQTLSEVAAYIGVFGQPDKMMRHKVYEFAGKKPLDYFNTLEQGDRPVRALVRKGIADAVLTQKGSVVMWDNTVLGHDENAAVTTLLGDTKMLEGLKEKVALKIQPKKGGRPKKDEK